LRDEIKKANHFPREICFAIFFKLCVVVIIVDEGEYKNEAYSTQSMNSDPIVRIHATRQSVVIEIVIESKDLISLRVN
jgi:hypothetical protein